MFAWRTMRTPWGLVAGVTPHRQIVPPGQSIACCTFRILAIDGWVMVGGPSSLFKGVTCRARPEHDPRVDRCQVGQAARHFERSAKQIELMRAV